MVSREKLTVQRKSTKVTGFCLQFLVKNSRRDASCPCIMTSRFIARDDLSYSVTRKGELAGGRGRRQGMSRPGKPVWRFSLNSGLRTQDSALGV